MLRKFNTSYHQIRGILVQAIFEDADGGGTGFEIAPDMRWIAPVILIAALAGCSSQTANVAPSQQAQIYQPGCSAALAFDPPVISGMPRLDLSRDGRGTAAFAGFQQESTTYYFLQTDDYYSDYLNGPFGLGNGYQRDAVSQTYGLTYR